MPNLPDDRRFDSLRAQPDLRPIADVGPPFGFTGPLTSQTRRRPELIAATQLATKVMADPLLMRLLCDRVYDLMRQDLSNQQERSNDYRRIR